MSVLAKQIQRRFVSLATLISGLMVVFAILVPKDASALPAFARQTGQNCVSCHAGGQFPELTPYGRMFKLTGYTMGERTIPLAVMAVANYAKVADTTKSDNPNADFAKNGAAMFATGSLFIAGKVTDNIGVFSQISYDNYAGQAVGSSGENDGRWQGHSGADNIDIRFADRFIDGNRDLIFGVSANNNPSVVDPWNTAAAWMQYVPASSVSSHQFSDANSPYPGFGSGDHIAGLNVYAYWNKTLYAELGTYRSANRGLSFMSAGVPNADRTKLSGANNPYWRLAYTREWGAHNLMVGATGMVAHRYDDPTDTSDPNSISRYKNLGIDAQYQYLLDPHAITAQVAYMRQKVNYSQNTLSTESPYFLADGVTPAAAINSSDTTDLFRAKLSYIYQAKYGGSVAFFNLSGTTNTLNQTSGYDSSGQITSDGISSTRVNGSLSGNPGTRGMTYEAFWMPIQYVRIGAQYTMYSRFNGASTNYDGFGRNAKDNNTLFLYVWAAY